MSDVTKEDAFRREYLATEGRDLEGSQAVFIGVDLLHGVIRAYGADEYARTTPPLVGAGWHMRWGIPPLANDGINSLIDRLAPHAESLIGMSAIREEPLGVILYAGAGTSLDLIQQECVKSWRSFLGECR